MADADVQITAGSGTKIDTRTVGAGTDEHRQVVVLGDPSTAANVAAVTADGSLCVQTFRDQVRVSVQSAGLTTASTTYTAGDQCGTMLTLSGMARANGGGGVITGVVIIDASDVVGALDVVLFRTNVTLAADNAAFSISDASALEIVAVVQCAGAIDIGGNRVVQALNLAVPYVCDSGGTALYAAFITRANNAVFAAGATSLQLIVHAERY